MGIFDSAIKGTKDFTDTARLNAMISEEKKQIQTLYTQIGKLYYETNPHNEETPLGKLCINIDLCNQRISEREEEKMQIKGEKKCPKCGASINSNSAFCIKCGAKIEVTPTSSLTPPLAANANTAPKKFCTGCGKALPDGATFCTSCGKQFAPVSPIVPEKPAETAAPTPPDSSLISALNSVNAASSTSAPSEPSTENTSYPETTSTPAQTETSSTQSKKFCTECGTEIPENCLFCTSCGKKQN